MDWTKWRIFSSDKYNVSLGEIEWQWSIDDVWDAHEVLDLYEESEALAARANRK